MNMGLVLRNVRPSRPAHGVRAVRVACCSGNVNPGAEKPRRAAARPRARYRRRSCTNEGGCRRPAECDRLRVDQRSMGLPSPMRHISPGSAFDLEDRTPTRRRPRTRLRAGTRSGIEYGSDPNALQRSTMRFQESTSVGGDPVSGKMQHSNVPRNCIGCPFSRNCLPFCLDLAHAERHRPMIDGVR